MAHLARNQAVQLHGLVAKPELNGRHGRALSFDVEKGRVLVEISPATTVALRPNNLTASSLLGEVVDIFGLASRPEYNGVKASVVQDYDPLSGRVTVLVGAEEKHMALKPSNIQVAAPFPSGQSAAEAKVAEQLEQLRAGVKGEGLPDGWECMVHSRPNGERYKRYKGPNGLRAQSLKQAWVTHARASDKGLYNVLEGLEKASPQTPTESKGFLVTGLPDGWVCLTHTRPSGEQYKRYKGPDGERAQSMKQAWVLHAARLTPSDGSGAVTVAAGSKSAAAKRQRTGVEVEVEEGGGGDGCGEVAARPFVCAVPGCGKDYTDDKGLYQHQRARHPELLSALRAELLASRKPAAANRRAVKRPLGCTDDDDDDGGGSATGARRCEGSTAMAGGGGDDDDSDDSEEATTCTVCGSAEDEPGRNDILLCDACDAGYHMSCLQPPLEAVPSGDWFCARCAARGGMSACLASVSMPAGWEEVPILWSLAFVWPKGIAFTETLSGQSGGGGALKAPSWARHSSSATPAFWGCHGKLDGMPRLAWWYRRPHSAGAAMRPSPAMRG
jgi:hypothetical protein